MVVLIILIVLTSFVFLMPEAQQRNSSFIDLDSTLSPASNESYWSSESGHFAFGFYPERDGYTVSIWLPKIKQKTVVWTANRDEPPLSSDARLILRSDGRLVLQVNQEQEGVIADTSQPASSAAILDSGNFVLYNQKLEIIWQTFNFPTDTILSTQKLFAVNHQQLVSSKSETDHSSGKFQILMQTDGNLVQYPSDLVLTAARSYWNSGTYNFGNSTSLTLDSNGTLYLQNSSGLLMKIVEAENVSFGVLYRATIDTDGIFRAYSLNLSGSGNWFIRWSSSTNGCDPKGICGLNGYCTFAGQSQEPVCACPPGFDFIDAVQRSLGCQSNYTAYNCSNSSAFSFKLLNDVLWEDNSYFNSSMSQIQCQEECARDCKCGVALYAKGICSKQLLPLLLGRNSRRKAQEMITLVKVHNGAPWVKTGGGKRKNNPQIGILITWIVLSTTSFLSLVIISILVYKYRVLKYKKISSQGDDELLEDVTLRSYTYDELKDATNNFTNQIGKGAFGTVFRGIISNSKKVVAIKRLEIVVAEGEREFRNEMKAIGRTHHKNLVRLLGYCHDGTNRLLVYEFMSNGSLADFLFKSKRKPVWEDRIEISLNIARGILYLHEDCPTQIIHCDIKPENILMDEKECPKIADFGLSKLLLPNQSKTYTGLRGTRGYVAPEWHRNSPITVKADVYSFGIMLLEIVCCRRNVDMDASEDEVVLANFVYDCFEAGEVNNLVQDEELETSELDRMVRVGLWCIQDEPSVRPSMKKVVLMLEGTIDIPAPPNPPSFASSI